MAVPHPRPLSGGEKGEDGSHVHALECDALSAGPREVRRDFDVDPEPLHVPDGFPEVFALPGFELTGRDVQPVGVVGTALVRDQDNQPDLMDADQKSKLLGNPFFFAISAEVARQAGRPAGNGQPVIARQAQAIKQEIVDLLTEPAVAAIHGGRIDAVPFEGDPTAEFEALVGDSTTSL